MVKINQILALVYKEFLQIFRNKGLIILMIVYPLFSLFIVSHLINFNIKNINIAVVDNDHSDLSEKLILGLDYSDRITLISKCHTYQDANKLLSEGSVDCIVTFPADFETQIIRNNQFKGIDISVNASNSLKAILGSGLVYGSLEHSLELNQNHHDVEFISYTNLFNQIVDYLIFMLPVMLMSVGLEFCTSTICVIMTNEKLYGTIDLINVTPVTRSQYIFSKLFVNLVLATASMLFSFLIYELSYDFQPKGGYAPVIVIYLISNIAIFSVCIFLSNICKNSLQTSLSIGMFVAIMQVMSGFLTPVDCMHDLMQYLTIINPGRYLVLCLRNIYLKGAGFTELWVQYVYCSILAVVTVIMAILSYKKKNL